MIGKKQTTPLGVAVAIVCGALCGAQAQTRPPAEAFAVLPVKAPEISPDGTHFALIRGVNGRPSLEIYKVDAPQDPPLVVTADDWIIAYARWVKNDVLIIYDKKNFKLGVFDRYNRDILRPMGDAGAISLKDGKIVRLTAAAQIVDVNLDDPDVIYAKYENSVYRMNVRTGGRPEPYIKKYLGAAHEETEGWFLDGHGKALARVDAVPDSNSFQHGCAPEQTVEVLCSLYKPLWHNTLKVPDKDSWHALGTYDVTIDQPDGVAGVSEDGRAVIRLATHAEGTMSVDRIDIATGVETTLFQDPTYDVRDTLQDEWTGKVIGYVVDKDMPEYHYFGSAREALQKGLEQAFPGLSVRAVSTDLAGDKAILEVVGPRMPPSYYLFDRTTHHATAIAASYPDLNDSELGEVKSYGYAARDGMHIPAYLTLPPGRQAKNLPMVVMPHGGPDARDDMKFDFLREFLANRGYAVLQPNFRGSAGYGFPFTKAGLHQWGLKMQDDISDGVKKVIADGIADPKRVCIFGASYGGYAALAGATLTPDLYACVISYAGVSNLPGQLGYDKRQFQEDFTHGSFTSTRMGDIFTDSAQLDATSPALHADSVKSPVLLLHSEQDVTVPIEQSEKMAAALQNAGKKYDFIRIEGDDHYLSVSQTRLRLLQEVEKFLAANIGT
ncbi:MAG TPA: S9 family peptidase [Rhizomicrobium sp.]|jgi:dipeptidyl aminopeptidase/acylaminoacyl peptidase|nr:S9 family peptidase [Rhizomicrobium sp.]